MRVVESGSTEVVLDRPRHRYTLGLLRSLPRLDSPRGAPLVAIEGARREAGETIGSGSGEKGGDIVVNRRLKGRRGMRGWRAHADGVVALRLATLNDQWDARLAAARAA